MVLTFVHSSLTYFPTFRHEWLVVCPSRPSYHAQTVPAQQSHQCALAGVPRRSPYNGVRSGSCSGGALRNIAHGTIGSASEVPER